MTAAVAVLVAAAAYALLPEPLLIRVAGCDPQDRRADADPNGDGTSEKDDADRSDTGWGSSPCAVHLCRAPKHSA